MNALDGRINMNCAEDFNIICGGEFNIISKGDFTLTLVMILHYNDKNLLKLICLLRIYKTREGLKNSETSTRENAVIQVEIDKLKGTIRSIRRLLAII